MSLESLVNPVLIIYLTSCVKKSTQTNYKRNKNKLLLFTTQFQEHCNNGLEKFIKICTSCHLSSFVETVEFRRWFFIGNNNPLIVEFMVKIYVSCHYLSF